MRNFSILMSVLLSLFSAQVSAATVVYEPYVFHFDGLYERGGWGGQGSGSGSIPENAKEYIQLLQKYINIQKFKTIVDLGCGDWQIMRTIEIPEDTSYAGYDVATRVIVANKKFERSNVEFIHTSGINDFVQRRVTGDLLIIKDVLQHIPNEDIKIILQEVLPNFKYALITNNFKGSKRRINADTKIGGFRPLELLKSPFNLQDTRVLLEYAGPEYKQVLLYKNPN